MQNTPEQTAYVSIPEQVVPIPHEPSPRQRQFLAMGFRYGFYGGRAGSGKSDTLLAAAAQGLMIPNYAALLLRRTYADLSLPGALMDRAASWWRGSGAHWSAQDKRWTFPIGSTVTFGYLENAADLQRYQSSEFHYIGFDESPQFPGKSLSFLSSRLRRTNEFPDSFPLRVRFAGNPGGVSFQWHLRKFSIPVGKEFPPNSPPIFTRVGGKIRRVFLPASAADNPGLDWTDYLESLSELDSIERMQLERGIWIPGGSGLVYHAISNVTYAECLPDETTWEYVLAIDVGASKNTAFALLAICPWRPEVYLVRAWEPSGCNTPRGIASEIRRVEADFELREIVGDHGALGKGYFEELAAFEGIWVSPAKKSDKCGAIKLLNAALETGALVVLREGTETWQEQATTLPWADESRTKEAKGVPNHSTDAALYGYKACRHYLTTEAPKPPPPGLPKDEIDIEEEADGDGDYRIPMRFRR